MGGLKITFNYLKSLLALQKSTASAGWGHFGTNPKILESLEGPEGYLCPAINILGIISIYGKLLYTSGLGLLIFLKSQLQYFCYQAELHATMPHCAVLLFDIQE